MDTLPESKQAAIRKLRTVRLQKELIERGFDDEEVELMSRSRLEEEWGNIVTLGRDTPPEDRSPEKLVASASDPNQEIEMRRLAFEERKYEEEKEERRRREEEGRRRDAEERAERKERELESIALHVLFVSSGRRSKSLIACPFRPFRGTMSFSSTP